MVATAPPNIVRAACSELIVTDLDGARWFWVDMLGFALTAADGEALYLRGYEETTHHCLVLRKGPVAAAIAFRVDQNAYPDIDAFWDDLIAAYREEVAQSYSAGCRYLQLDEVSFAYLCDADFRAPMTARVDDPDAMILRHRDAMNAVIADRPDDLFVSTHMCRGNFRSRWVASGGYEPIAERVFGGLDVDAFFLEFDSERAGGFEPLRYLPPNKTVVLGLVTTKTPELEGVDELKRRIDEAAAIVAIEQLAISPHAGSPAPTTATTSPKTTSGSSSAGSSRSPARSGARRNGASQRRSTALGDPRALRARGRRPRYDQREMRLGLAAAQLYGEASSRGVGVDHDQLCSRHVGEASGLASVRALRSTCSSSAAWCGRR